MGSQGQNNNFQGQRYQGGNQNFQGQNHNYQGQSYSNMGQHSGAQNYQGNQSRNVNFGSQGARAGNFGNQEQTNINQNAQTKIPESWYHSWEKVANDGGNHGRLEGNANQVYEERQEAVRGYQFTPDPLDSNQNNGVMPSKN